MRDPGRLKPKTMLSTARKSWLDRMLDTKAVSEDAKRQREHDRQAVAARKEAMSEGTK